MRDGNRQMRLQVTGPIRNVFVDENTMTPEFRCKRGRIYKQERVVKVESPQRTSAAVEKRKKSPGSPTLRLRDA